MAVWCLALAAALALSLTAFFWPYRLTLSLQARGVEDGHFAAAGGAQLGPLTATVAVARGVPLTVALAVFGRRLTRAPNRPEEQRGSEPEQPAAPSVTPRWVQRIKAKIELSAVLDYLLGKRRWIGLDGLELGLEYSSKNVALTGQILAALCAVSALLPAKVTLRQQPSWELVDRATLSMDGRFRVRPGLFICDTLWFLVRTFMLPSRPALRRA
ncbi:MAG TPA: hypothetical protein VI197_26130 [Polyangiaceae bacterium]